MIITTKEIAQICGVSRGTVDRALNNKPGINSKTKEEILRVAKEHGYSPNHVGRSLAKGKTFSLGVIVFDFKNQYFSQMLNAIEMQTRENGFALLIMMSEKNVELEKKAIRSLYDRRIDGIILHPVGFDKAYEKFLKRINIPIVTLGNHLSDAYDYISIDNHQAGYEAVLHIEHHGYEQIVFIAPPLRKKNIENISAQEERRDGYLKAMSEVGLEPLVIGDKGYINQAFDLISSASHRIAFLCSSDAFALELMKAIRKSEFNLSDVGIMGFDRIEMLDYIVPKLSTVFNPIEETGVTAVDRLIKRIEKPEMKPQTITIKHEIVVGETL